MAQPGSRLARIARWLGYGLALAVLIPLGVLTYAYWETQWPPVVRTAEVRLADWPAGAKPVRVLLVSDVHVVGPDMPPERLARIVDGLNALKPDLVLLAGDYISEKNYATRYYSPAEAVAPLARFRAPLGIVAVLGNHDHWADSREFRAVFARYRIPLLINEAIKRGPFVIGGADDRFSGHDDLPATEQAMAALGPGPRLLLTHTPDLMLHLGARVDAVLAGHTHCGQVVLPLIGPIAGHFRPWHWLPCGKLDVKGTPLFVGAGLGTSVLPVRLGARPDVWLIRFGPKR